MNVCYNSNPIQKYQCYNDLFQKYVSYNILVQKYFFFKIIPGINCYKTYSRNIFATKPIREVNMFVIKPID